MKNSVFAIRSATDADAGAVRGLVFPIMKEFGLGLAPEGIDADLFGIDASYAGRGGWLELVFCDSDLVGTVGMYPVEPGVIELRKMYLRADMRGAGLGKAMLARSIRRARQAGFKEIVLDTATVLEAAIGLYRRFGFTRDEGGRPDCGKKACDQSWRLQLDCYELPAIDFPQLQEQ